MIRMSVKSFIINLSHRQSLDKQNDNDAVTELLGSRLKVRKAKKILYQKVMSRLYKAYIFTKFGYFTDYDSCSSYDAIISCYD